MRANCLTYSGVRVVLYVDSGAVMGGIDRANMGAGRVILSQPKRYLDDRQVRKYWLVSIRKIR